VGEEKVYLPTLPPYRSDTSINFFFTGVGQESSRSGAYAGGWVWEEKQNSKKVAGREKIGNLTSTHKGHIIVTA